MKVPPVRGEEQQAAEILAVADFEITPREMFRYCWNALGVVNTLYSLGLVPVLYVVIYAVISLIPSLGFFLYLAHGLGVLTVLLALLLWGTTLFYCVGRSAAKMRGHRRIEINSRGLKATAEGADVNAEWSYFRGLREFKDALLLETMPNSGFWLRPPFFESEEQWHRAAEVIRQNVAPSPPQLPWLRRKG